MEGIALKPTQHAPMPNPSSLARPFLLRIAFLCTFLFLSALFVNIYLFHQTHLSTLAHLEHTLKNSVKDLDLRLLSMHAGFSNVCSVFRYEPLLSAQAIESKILPFLSDKTQFYCPILFRNGYEGCLLYGDGSPKALTSTTKRKISQLLSHGPKIFEDFLRLFPEVSEISYLCEGFKLICPWHSFPPSVNPEWLQDAQSLAGALSFPLLHEHPTWLPFAYKAVEKNWYVRYIRPILSQGTMMGSFSFSLPQTFFKSYVSSFPLPFGKILMIDQENTVLASQEKGKPIDTKVQFLEEAIPPGLLTGKRENLFSKPGELHYQHIRGHTGFWTAAMPLQQAPWKLVLVASWWDVIWADFMAIFGGGFLLFLTSFLIVIYSYILLKRYFLSPSYQLIRHIQQERNGVQTNVASMPEIWRPWADFISTIFSENRHLILELENRVQERTQALNDVLTNLQVSQNQIIAQEKLAGLGTLTAGIAHEIKNPLNFVLNFAQLSQELLQELKKTSHPDGETLKNLNVNLEKIMEHANRADHILNSMLSHARTPSSTPEEVDINEFVSEYMDLCYQSFTMKHKDIPLKLEKKLDPMAGKQYIYPQDLGRVLLNLLNNAFGTVKARLEKTTPKSYQPTVLIKTQATQEGVTILVHDNGEGIPASLQKKIFNPFFTTKAPGEGTGLGLSISYDCIQRHRGTLKVESQEGEGSWFIIELPKNALATPEQE